MVKYITCNILVRLLPNCGFLKDGFLRFVNRGILFFIYILVVNSHTSCFLLLIIIMIPIILLINRLIDVAGQLPSHPSVVAGFIPARIKQIQACSQHLQLSWAYVMIWEMWSCRTASVSQPWCHVGFLASTLCGNTRAAGMQVSVACSHAAPHPGFQSWEQGRMKALRKNKCFQVEAAPQTALKRACAVANEQNNLLFFFWMEARLLQRMRIKRCCSRQRHHARPTASPPWSSFQFGCFTVCCCSILSTDSKPVHPVTPNISRTREINGTHPFLMELNVCFVCYCTVQLSFGVPGSCTATSDRTYRHMRLSLLLL